MMTKITPFLWFNNQAEEAANFYISLFPHSKIIDTSPMVVTFELEGQRLMALNGGPNYKFTEAISMFVCCDDQDEVDNLWEKLSKQGEEGQCGWLKDKYGLSWQIIPKKFMELMSDTDTTKTERLMKAMYSMKKMIMADLQQAFDGTI